MALLHKDPSMLDMIQEVDEVEEEDLLNQIFEEDEEELSEGVYIF